MKTRLTDLEEGDLDELVHDVHASQAADTNNEGTESQIQFLQQNGYTEQELLDHANQQS